MRFNEKLQYLRREAKMSQEALADMLDVTRQSVSKWESGTTYPEMDKLIMLCKIFKCSLDDLTNDDIVEIKVDGEKHNESPFSINGFLNGFLGFISKTVKMFQTMSFKQIVGCIFTMLILGVLLLIFLVPVSALSSAFSSFVIGFNQTGVTYFISGLFNFILMAIFVALYVIVLIYIFKVAYLDRYEFLEKVESEKSEVVETKEKVVPEVKVVERPSSPNENPLFKFLGGIALGFIKFLIACFSMPVVFIMVLLCLMFAIDVYLLGEGIIFIGITLLIVLGVVACIWLLEIASVFLFNRKVKFTRLLWTFFIVLIGIGLSLGISILELTSFDYINSAPEGEEFLKTVDKKEYTMTDDLAIDIYHSYRRISYQVDEELEDRIVVELEYYKDFVYPYFSETSSNIAINVNYESDTKYIRTVLKDIKKNFKNKVFYDYGYLQSVNVVIKGSKENLDKIAKNTEDLRKKTWQSDYNARLQETINGYEVEINNYESRIDVLESQNETLQEKIDELEEYKRRVQETIN